MQLRTWQTLADDDLLGQVVWERMLEGLAPRRHTQAAEPVGATVQQTATATSKSAIPRGQAAGGAVGGSTENATVVRHLLADLQARGLDASRGRLVVIDGPKALATRCVACSASSR